MVPKELKENNTSQTVFYTIDSWTKGNQHDYVSVIFYDFKLSYLELDGEAASAVYGCDTLEEAQEKTGSGFKYSTAGSGETTFAGITNRSAITATLAQTLEKSKSTSISNTVESMRGYDTTSTIGTTVSVEQKIPFSGTAISASVSAEFSKTETFTETKGTAKTVEDRTVSTVTSTVAVPAHSVVMLQQEVSKMNMEITYDYPVAITYKVITIYSNAAYKADDYFAITAIFGDDDFPDAQSNLLYRYQHHDTHGNESKYSCGYDVDWNKAMAYYGVRFKDKKDYSVDNWYSDFGKSMTYYRPMSRTGGVLSVAGEGVNTIINGFIPLYPLTQVTTSLNEYTLNSGEVRYLRDIPLIGLNIEGVPYDGFKPAYGEWKLVGADGDTASADTSIATISDDITGIPRLTAGNKIGTVYLKYFIDEQSYKHNESKRGLF